MALIYEFSGREIDDKKSVLFHLKVLFLLFRIYLVAVTLSFSLGWLSSCGRKPSIKITPN
jgi:hypothetical protein